MSDPTMPPPPEDGSGSSPWGQPPAGGPWGGQGGGQWADQGGQWGDPSGQGQWGAPAPWGGAPQPRPSTMLPWSIAVTLLCCLPTGIAAIVFAAKADSAFGAGDHAGGMRYHAQARTWTIVSVVAWPIIAFAGFVLVLMGGLASEF